MGCIPSKRKLQSEFELITNSSPGIFKRFKEKIVSELGNPEKIGFVCRKFIIPEPEPKIFQLDIVKLYQVTIKDGHIIGAKMMQVIQDFQNFNSARSYFYTNTHHVCMQEISIEIVLTAFVIFCLINGAQVGVSLKYPFIEVEKNYGPESDLVKSWTEFILILNEIHAKYENAKFFVDLRENTELLVSKYKDSKDEKGKKKFKYFSQILKIYNDFIKEIRESYKKVKLFCRMYAHQKQDLESILKALQGVNVIKCENLVHYMF